MIWTIIMSIAFAQTTYPKSHLTPGKIATDDVKLICSDSYTKKVRAVSEKTKHDVFTMYGFKKGSYKPGNYEIDHFISLELGGSNDIENLWPQPYCKKGNDALKTGCFGAREKDVVETSLHKRICKHQLTPEEAQQIIRTDWVREYKRIKDAK